MVTGCRGLHCDGCGHGRGVLWLVLAAAGMLAAAGAAAALARALAVLIFVFVLAALMAAVLAIVYFVRQIQTGGPGAGLVQISHRPSAALTPGRARPELEGHGRHYHLHLHGVTPGDVVQGAVIRNEQGRASS